MISMRNACPEDLKKTFSQTRHISLLADVGKEACDWMLDGRNLS